MVATSALAAGASTRVRGANDRVRVGLIGCGGRGRLVAGLMRDVPGVEIGAVCDVYEPHRTATHTWAGGPARAHADFRRVLDDRTIDAVIVATPDHWHGAITVLACQSGKDVYVEKPLGHTVREGRAIVNAASAHKRVVQHGTQQRSSPHYAEAARLVQGGALGSVRFVRIWNFVNMYPEGIGRAADSTPPPGADWDMFLGPSPAVPFNKNRFVGTYRWFWDYGGGLVTDFGIHRFDSLHQVMNAHAPKTIAAAGARFDLADGAETPDLVQVTYEYPGFVLSYEATMLNAQGTGHRTPGREYYGARGATARPHGEAYYGTNGTLLIDRIGFEVIPELNATSGPGAVPPRGAPDGLRTEARALSATDATAAHVRNFVECVRSRQAPMADPESGQRSSTVAHLGNIAFRTGHKISWDADREEIVGDDEAALLLHRQARNPWGVVT